MSKNGHLRCSFCGKGKDQVEKLISGPSVYICNGCVTICVEILVEDGGDKTMQNFSAKSLLFLGISPFTPSDLAVVDELGFDAHSFLSRLLDLVPALTGFGDTINRINEEIQERMRPALEKKVEAMDIQISHLEQEAELLAKLKDERALLGLKLTKVGEKPQ